MNTACSTQGSVFFTTILQLLLKMADEVIAKMTF